MKVLLINPPWWVGKRQGVRAGSRWPHLKIPEEDRYMPYPFYLGYATSLLKKNNFEVKAIDAIAEGLSNEKFKEKVYDYSPDFIVSETSTPTMDQDLELLKEIKNKKKCKIAIAGPDVNLFTEKFLKKNIFIDFVLIGEYDFTILDLLKSIKLKKDLSNVKGILFRKKNKIINNGRALLKQNIDQLPWPDREDFPIYNYHDCPGGIPEPSAQLWASRGCSYQCVFCLWPQVMYGGSNYRIRNVVDVVDEIEVLVKSKNFKSFYFDDDTFNIGKKRMLNFAKELRSRNLNVPWAFMGRADLSDRETLVSFRISGLYAVKYGVESGVQELVDRAKKNLNLEKAIENIKITKELGIKVHLTFTFGLPGETKETIMKTINLALKLDPDSVQFSIMTPFPGTKLYEDMKALGNIESFYSKKIDGNTKSVIRKKSLSPDDLKRAQDYAYKKWDEHKFKKQRYKQLSPIKLFKICFKEHGLKFTIKKIIRYITNGNFLYYFGISKVNRTTSKN